MEETVVQRWPIPPSARHTWHACMHTHARTHTHALSLKSKAILGSVVMGEQAVLNSDLVHSPPNCESVQTEIPTAAPRSPCEDGVRSARRPTQGPLRVRGRLSGTVHLLLWSGPQRLPGSVFDSISIQLLIQQGALPECC